MKNTSCFLAIVTAICLIAGCDNRDPNRPQTYPTTIKITMGGSAVPEATITLNPTDSANTNTSYGQTDADGVCELTTFDTGDGVVAGEYDVAIRKVETITEPDPSEEDPNGVRVVEERWVVPQKYSKFGNGEKVTVTAEGPNEFSIELEE